MGARRVVGLIGWPLLWLAIGLVVGAAVRAGVSQALGADESAGLPAGFDPEVDPQVFAWMGVVAAGPVSSVVAGGAGIAVGGLVWMLGLILSTRRLFPAGFRGLPVALAAGVAVVLSFVGLLVLGAGPEPTGGAIVATLVAAFVLGGLVFVFWGARVDRLGVRGGGELDAGPDVPGADALADWIGRR